MTKHTSATEMYEEDLLEISRISPASMEAV